MKTFVMHGTDGKVKSFGVANNCANVRAGLHAGEGTTVAVVDLHVDEVHGLRQKRGNISSKLSVGRNAKSTELKIS